MTTSIKPASDRVDRLVWAHKARLQTMLVKELPPFLEHTKCERCNFHRSVATPQFPLTIGADGQSSNRCAPDFTSPLMRRWVGTLAKAEVLRLVTKIAAVLHVLILEQRLNLRLGCRPVFST